MRSLSSSLATVGAVAILITSLVGCGGDSSSSTSGASADELFEQGPFEVGYRELTINYTEAATLEDRELLLRVWYPAQEGSGKPPATYAVGGIINLPAAYALDAPPVTDQDNLPFVVHSHGNGGEGLLAYPYGELMASHGWVLVAPNHTGNTAFDFLDMPDTSSVVLLGHSFGGDTPFASGGAAVDFDGIAAGCEGVMSAACDLIADPDVEAAYRAGFLDERIVALAPQAPAIGSIADGELAKLGVPTMLMSGLLDQTTTQEESAVPAWMGLDHEDDLWVEMPKGAHFSFISICHDLSQDLLDFFRPDAGQDGCGLDFIDTQEALPVLAAYVLAFGRRHVLGQTEWDPILTGPPLGNDGDFIVRVK